MNAFSQLAKPAGSKMVLLAHIRAELDSQARVQIRPATVHEYALAMKEQAGDGGLRFPAVVLFGFGPGYHVGDGFHRIQAAREAEQSEILAEVRPGGQREALLWSITSNADHGLPRTNADKRKAVTLLLADAEWSQWSDHEIARRAQVSQGLVTKLRHSASDHGDQITARKVCRGGTVYMMEPKATPTGKGDDPPAAPAAEPASTDALGLPLRPALTAVFAGRAEFDAVLAVREQLASAIDQLARTPAGAALGQQLLRRLENGQLVYRAAELEGLRQKLSSAVPHAGRCPLCHARRSDYSSPSCRLCAGRGWLTRAAFDTCPHDLKQALMRLKPEGACNSAP
jgi:hypothetical protein